MITYEETKALIWMQEVGQIEFLSYQRKFLLSCIRSQRVVGCFCRQTGKTTIVGLFALWYAFNHPNQTVLIIAPTDRQASELFNRMKWKAENRLGLKLGTLREIKFENGSIIRALPTGDSGATIRGQTANVIICEESGHMKEEIFNQVIMPMLAATNGKLIQIGTPKGKNHFFSAKESEDYDVHLVDYTQCELIKPEFIEEQRKNLTDMEFRTEYCAEFIEDSDCFYPYKLAKDRTFDYEETGRNPNLSYTLGVDFARLGEDSTVMIVIEQDKNEFKVVKVFEQRHKLLNEAVGMIKQLDSEYRFSKIILDETGLGAGAVDVLRESIGYKLIPITFTMQNKMDLHTNLKLLMEQKRIKIINHKKLFDQIVDLRYEMLSTGQFKLHHSDRGHDDFVTALALAVFPFKQGKKDICWDVIGV